MKRSMTAPRALGARGPEVAPLCLGTMNFGDLTPEAEAHAIMAAYAEAGGRFIDTADAYCGGDSERIVGRFLGGVTRGDFVLATKVGNPVRGRDGSGGLTPAWMRQACAESLERLATDYIDLYYLHLDDEATPFEDTLGAMAELLASGVVRAWAISNYRGWKVAEIIRLCNKHGVTWPVAAQPYYHALNRLAEIDFLPACAHFGIGVATYSPLARGLLTGKYSGGAAPEGSRAARGDPRILETDFRPDALAAADAIVAYARSRGKDPVGFALAWALGNELVDSVLVGPKTMAQWCGYLQAFEATAFDAADEAAVEAVNATGLAIGAWADPRYPYRGRVAAFA